MKTLFINLALVCLCNPIVAQVVGQLKTAAGQPIPFANVQLVKSADSSFVKATLTNDNGLYQLDVRDTGSYLLRVSSLGYQSWDSPVFALTPAQPGKDFGVQMLREDTQQLGEVVIRAQKSLYEQTAQGTVINVESSVLSKGSSVLQVLERSPGVVIDYQNNSITLNGKSGVTVMLNGKLVRMSMDQLVALLNGMSANDIEKIELLTAPGARYDAEGGAGMINIVLKKSAKPGTNGSYSLTGGYGVGEKGVGSINLAHNLDRINLYGSYTFSHDRSYSFLTGSSTQNMPLLGGQMDVLFQNTARPVQDNHNTTLGIDAKLSPKTTIGANLMYANLKTASTASNYREFTFLPDSLVLFTGTIRSTNRWKNLLSSVYVENEVGKRGRLTLNLDYLHYKNDNPTDVQSASTTKDGTEVGAGSALFSPRQQGFANTLIQVGVVKLDYVNQLNKNLKLEAGIKGAYTTDASVSGVMSLINGAWVSRAETSNDIRMQERIGAVYTAIQAQLNPFTTLSVGARYEYSHTYMKAAQTQATLVDRRLGKLFPNVLVTRKLGDEAELQLAYTKRISRPSYNELASFVAYNDPVSVFTGNPLLRPTITNSLKLGYTYRSYAFAVLLSRDDYPISRYQLTESPTGDFLYLYPQNGIYQNNLTVQTNVPWKVTDWWNMNYGFAGGWRQYKEDFSKQPLEKTYFGYSLTVNQTIKLPKNFLLDVSGWYNGPSYDGTIRTDAFGALNAGIKKELKKNGGTLQLTASDLLRTTRYSNRYGTLTEEAFSGKSHATFNPESRQASILKLTYFKSFGTTKSTLNRKQGASDERNRIQN